ncbi:MAG TPA: YebC/PmpR family DNA-binding transcriptional regulator [Candidatus Paceibacterota bacterium]|nr:YebC/PmpR family DNA-binding transcriptional regulator [Candidatus Paceibacterota bacterium]
MSGHSKWSQIKHKKAAADAKKSAVFGKLARAISVAARGNPDPTTNLRLQAEMQRARAVNMPSDSIERAIRRVADKDAVVLQEIHLEFIGPGNAAVVAFAITDNSNRTISELRLIATNHGGHIADPGSVLWVFRKSGVVLARVDQDSADALQLTAIDAGADDVDISDGELTAVCAPEHLDQVRRALGAAVVSSSITFIATNPLQVSDQALRDQLGAFIEALDDHEDVQEVFTNATDE